ncbi:hypothetical protein NC652_039498 [Populus alba x Populus x berolinensis]|nr:hypothetical protein NC652_039498 [Populus alba x Populus x berolinensis]
MDQDFVTIDGKAEEWLVIIDGKGGIIISEKLDRDHEVVNLGGNGITVATAAQDVRIAAISECLANLALL